MPFALGQGQKGEKELILFVEREPESTKETNSPDMITQVWFLFFVFFVFVFCFLFFCFFLFFLFVFVFVFLFLSFVFCFCFLFVFCLFFLFCFFSQKRISSVFSSLLLLISLIPS